MTTVVDRRIANLHARGLLPLVQEIAAHFGVVVAEIVGEQRCASVVAARHYTMAVLRRKYGFSYPQLGRIFGRDHTSCMHAVRKVMAEPDASLTRRRIA